MNGLGGLNPSPNGVVIGMAQLQLPVVVTPEDLGRQTARIVEMVGKAWRNMAGMDLVVFPEYALHGLSMDIDPAIMCSMDGPEVAAFRQACVDHAIWGCFSIMEANLGGMPWNTGLVIDDQGAVRLYYRKMHPWVVAVKEVAQDCPYSFMQDMVAGAARLPWEAAVKITDGTSCGFPEPRRTCSTGRREAAE